MSGTVPGLLRDRAAEAPDAVALVVDGDATLSFGDWERRSAQMAAGLLARGVGRGDRVVLRFDNARWCEYAVGYLGVLKAGAVAVPLGTRLAGAELEAIVEHCRPSGVVCPSDLAIKVGNVWTAEVAELELVEPTGGAVARAGRAPAPLPGDLAEILYTSGTTGLPKGVALSHQNIVFFDPPPEERTEGAPARASFIHAFPVGTNAGQEVLRVPLRWGDRRAVVVPVFEADRFCALVEEHHVRRLQLVPAMAEAILASGAAQRYDLSSVGRVVLSSAPSPPSLLKRLAATLPQAQIWNTYALTEAGTARTLLRYDGRRAASVGRGVGGTEVRVAALPPGGPGSAPSTAGPGSVRPIAGPGTVRPSVPEAAEAGQEGEVWLRRPGAPARWYYRDPEASAVTFVDGWVRTGDVGYLDGDGFLYLTDRVKDLIIVGGLNVSSIEVENVLAECAGVAEAAVFGLPHPVLGQVVAAAVALREPLSEAQIRSFVRQRLADHKAPQRVFVVDSLPRNASGKVLKRQLRDLLAPSLPTSQEPAPAPAEQDHSPLCGDELLVATVWQDVLGLDRVEVGDDFFALGGHSLAAAQVIARLNDALAVTRLAGEEGQDHGDQLSPGALFEAPTVGELARLVHGLRAGAAAAGS